MSEDLINKIIDDENVQRSVDNLINKLKEVVKLIQDINKTGAKISFGGGGNATGPANANSKAAAQATDALTKAQERLKLAESQLGQEIATVNERTRQQNLQNRSSAQGAIAYSSSLNGMRSSLKLLTQQYDNYTAAQRKSKTEGQATLDQIKKLTEELNKAEQATGRFGRNVGNYPSAVKGFVGGAKGLLGAFGVSTGLYGAKQLLDEKAETSDQLGDLQRLLKLTTFETDKLFNSFKNLGTRTSTEGLLEIAAVLERIGVSRGSIAGMTEAIDKLHVVLGKDLGDPQKITQDLVMLENVYSKTGLITARSLEEIGNGILTLSHSGDTTAPFLIDFSKNLGGIAKAAKISLGEALGLGAGFQLLGQKAQTAGTATVQIMSRIASNVPKFAHIAGKSVEEFTTTLREKPIEALLEVAQGAQKGKPFFDEFAKSFKDLETKGVRVQGAITALGSSADLFRNKIKIASDALKETNNLNDQFAIKNNTLGASVDKLKKSFESLTSDPNSSIGKFFKFIIDQADLAIGYIDRMGNSLDRLTGNRNTFDVSPDNLSKYAKGSNRAKYRDVFQNAISDRKDQQQPFIDAFGEKNVIEQAKEYKELHDAIIDARKAQDDLRKKFKDTDPVLQSSAVGLIALSYRYTEYGKIINKTNKKLAGEGEDPYTPFETDKQKNAAADLEKRRLKAIEDRNKFELQAMIEDQKAIVDDEKKNFDVRLDAAGKYYQLKTNLADVEADGEKKRIEVELGRNKASAEELKTVDAKANRDKVKNRLEWSENIKKIVKDTSSDEVKQLLADAEDSKAEIDKRKKDELKSAQNYYKQGRISKEDYEALQLQIENKYKTESLLSEIDYQEKILKIRKNSGEDVTAEEAKLKQLKNDISAAELNYTDQIEKGKTEIIQKQLETRIQLQKDYAEKIKDVEQELVKFAGELIDGQFTRQKNKVQDEINLVEKKSEADTNAVNNSLLTEKEKADKLAIINLRTTAQKEALERKQKEIDSRAAQFQKLVSLLQIGVTTAESVFKIEAQAAVLASNPITASYAAVALGQIPLVIAAGAIQAAAIATKPIPRYFLGTDDHPGGMARVNDGGRLEVIEEPGIAPYVLSGMDKTISLKKHSKVHPSIPDYYKAASKSIFHPIQMVYDSNGSWKMANSMVREMSDTMQKVVVSVNNRKSERTIITAEGMKHQILVGNDWHDYVNKYMK